MRGCEVVNDVGFVVSGAERNIEEDEAGVDAGPRTVEVVEVVTVVEDE